jgi:alanine racemase
LLHNLTQTRRCLPKGCDILAIVKANAYGHGAVPVTKALIRAGIQRFGVATVAEGAQLREAGITNPILIVGALIPADIPALLHYRLTPVIYHIDMAQELAAWIPPDARPYPVHVKIDTGMGRLGLDAEQLPALLAAADWNHTLALEGLMTHLADADSADPSYTRQQLDRFRLALSRLSVAGNTPPLIHVANSAGIIRYPETHFALVRPGIMLYGYHTLTEPAAQASPLDLRPVLSWHSTVATVRQIRAGESVSYNRTFTAQRITRIAILPVGYADGFNRRLSNTGSVLIGGRRMPVVGRVCMDMTMVDVTELPGIKPGDPAVLLGRQKDASITAWDMAETLGSIPYEVLCAIGPRVPRLYSDESDSLLT